MSPLTRAMTIVLFGAVSFSVRGVAQDWQKQWKDSLKARITAWIAPSKVSSDRLRITAPGTVLVVQREGISASPGKDASYLKNYLREGQLHQAGGLAAALANKKTNRDYRAGERVYLHKVDVNDNDIQLFLLSLETNQITKDGNTEQTRYKAIVQVEFPRETLATTDFAAVQNIIGSILQIEGSAALASPKTVELGQTPEEVEAVLGAPDKVLKLGTKTVYVYKDIKVTFFEGKVADVQ